MQKGKDVTLFIKAIKKTKQTNNESDRLFHVKIIKNNYTPHEHTI